MRFGDYSKSYEIRKLKESMEVENIPDLPEPKYEREVTKVRVTEAKDVEYEELKKVLKGDGLVVRKVDIGGQAGEQLEYKGRKVCAYIRDQKGEVNFYHKTTSYRYHLCNCSTLRSMKAGGREARYLITERDDGFFKVNAVGGFRGGARGSGEVKMELCYNCMQELQNSKKYFKPFTLKEYFNRYNSDVPRTIRKETVFREKQTYTPDHEDYAREYKIKAKYKCQLCDVDCGEHKHLLHMHHKNGDPSNNKPYNIRILCVGCHSKEFQHSHMSTNPRFQKEILLLKALKKQQNIADF